MSEDVGVLPARQIKPGAHGQEVETGLGQVGAPLARQHDVQPLAHHMQVQHVGGGIGQLFGAEHIRAPVGRLLGLGQVHARQFAHHVLQAVPVGVGAGEL